MEYEFKIKILNKDYINILIVALARQGYAPYITEENDVCITINEEELEEIKEE
ncbi:MAG: hypothetical protein V1901_03925 [Patescibacteria group bacterium]